MPIATGTAIAIAAGVGAAGGLTKSIMGAKRAADARRALEQYQRQDLKNITEGMRVSTLGAELQTQEAQRRFATSVEALRAGGIRGVVGGLGQQEQNQQLLQQNISADLDKQQQQIEALRAEDEARIRAMQEQRETSEISGLGTEMALGREQVASGIGDIATAGMNAMAMSIGAGGASAGNGSLSSFGDASKPLMANYNGFQLPQASSFIGRSSTYKSPF
jgi:hypothetical protein